MSHFTTMLVLPSRPTAESISEAMAPFHEFECTGRDDKYVVEVDETAEARSKFETATRSMVRLASGEVVSRYHDSMYQKDKDGVKQWTLPEGAEEFDQPFPTFRDFLDYEYEREVVLPGDNPDLEGDHKYGYIQIDESGEVVKVVDRTNPNKQWDWCVVGGRWRGYLKAKPGIDLRGENAPQIGEASLLTAGEIPTGFDVIRKGDVDIEGMRQESADKAAKRYDEIRAIVDPVLEGFVSWEDMRGRHEAIEAAREAYHDQPAILAIKEAKVGGFFFNLDEYLVDRDAYIADARAKGCMAFSFLRDGQWAERGRMGWWATISDENEEWPAAFAKLLDAVPDDHWLVVVDCHI